MTPKVIERRDFVAGAALLLGCSAHPPRANAMPGEPEYSPAQDEPGPAARRSAPDSLGNPWPLFRRFPELRHRLPRVTLARLPTPVTAAPGIASHMGAPQLLIKHDDLSSPLYGGGKVRKLELFLGAARAQGKTAVVTAGAVGSHHCLATAIHARRLGLQTSLLLMHRARSPEVRRNLLAASATGADLSMVGGPSGVQRATATLLASDRGGQVYAIPTGGTNALGNLAYVNAALELYEQVAQGALPEPDVIYVALGTMGTAVGLAVGLDLTTLKTELVAVRVANVPSTTEDRFLAAWHETRRFLVSHGATVPEESGARRWRIEGRFLGRGYGLPTIAGAAARKLAAAQGLELEPTYTAKTMAAVLALAPAEKRTAPLFWNTHSAVEPSLGGVNRMDLPASLRGYG